MAKQQLDKSNLGYLGIDFQYKLAKVFVEEPKFFEDSVQIIEQNAFTDPNLREFVGAMKDYYNETNGLVPSYTLMDTLLRRKAKTAIDVEECTALINKLKFDTSSEGEDTIKELAIRFFKQQNLIKVANKILEIAGKGEIDRYPECQHLLDEASLVGQDDDFGFNIYDMTEKALSNDYTISIPTGIDKLDETLGGGLDKGKLGLLIAPAGFGKAQPKDARILTPNGYKLMGDMKVGDFVIGQDGKPHMVSGVFPQGKRPIYKVSFSNGASCECDEEHLWTVGFCWPKNSSFKVKTLKEIINDGIKTKGKNPRLKYRIPKVKPVDFIEQKVDINPYILGYYLGDGCCSRSNITVGKEDYQQVKEIFDSIIPNDVHIHYREKRHIYDFTIVGNISKILKDNFREIHSEEKYIPYEYLFNSIENRMLILQGLMDSDGHANKNGSCEFCSKSLQLAKDVQFLVRSLGGYASLTECNSSYYNKKKGERINCGKRYRVTISLCDESIKLFKLQKKQERVKYRKKYAENIFISNIEYIGEKDAQCIMVDYDDHMYITEDFIVTHNTSFTTAIDAYAATCRCDANNHEGFKVLQIFFEDDDVDITRKIFAKKLTEELPKGKKIEARELKRLNIQDRDEIYQLLMNHPDRELLTKNLRLKHFKTGVKTATDIGIFIKRLINSGFKPDLVTIDYFECIAPEKGGYANDSEWSREGVTMRVLENLAHEFNIAIWIPTQGTKDSMNSPDFVRMDQASGSAKKVHVAQLILSVSRQLDDIDRCRANIAILKNRSGKSGKGFKGIYFDNGTCTISCDEAIEFDSQLEWDKEMEREKEEQTMTALRGIAQRNREAQALKSSPSKSSNYIGQINGEFTKNDEF